MKSTLNLAMAASVLLLMAAAPAMAQNIDLSPVTNLLQGLVDTLTGPLGVVIGTLALIGVFITWLFGFIDFKTGIFVLVALVGIATAPTIVAAIGFGS